MTAQTSYGLSLNFAAWNSSCTDPADSWLKLQVNVRGSTEGFADSESRSWRDCGKALIAKSLHLRQPDMFAGASGQCSNPT